MANNRSEAAKQGWATRRANEAARAAAREARAERSRSAWERRWQEAYANREKLGKKGRQFIERTFGPIVERKKRMRDEWPDVWDWRDDDTGDCG